MQAASKKEWQLFSYLSARAANSVWKKWQLAQREASWLFYALVDSNRVQNLQIVNIGNAKSNEFTKKELVVLRLMTGGYSNQEIADKINVSINAVKKHISNMLTKTCLQSRTELAVKARETGIVILERDKDEY